MKPLRPITIEKFTSSRWLETREAERKAEERWSLAITIGGAVVALFLMWGAMWLLLGGQ